MRNSWASLCLLLAAIACDRSDAQLFAPPLRVAALPGLDAASFEPGDDAEGSVAAALDLVYDYVSDHATVVSQDGRRISLQPRAGGISAADLASRLAFRGLVDARVEDELVHVRFETEASARAFVSDGGVRNGVFVATEAPLRFLSDSPPYEIQPVVADWRNHWQLLVGGHVDVVPWLGSSEIRWLDGVDDIQLIEGGAQRFMLQLNPARLDRAQRRVLQRVIGVGAPGRVVCAGELDCNAQLPALAGTAAISLDDVSLPALEILAIEEAQEERLGLHAVANVVWRATGRRPTLVFLPVERALARYEAGDYAAFLMPFSSDASRFYRSLLPDGRRSLGGEPNENLSRAVAAEDWPRAAHIVHDEALVIPGWTSRYFAAMATGVWCAGDEVKPSTHSWAWIGQLRRCRER